MTARRDGSDRQMFPDRPAGKPVRNSGGASCPACTLQEAITKSLNTTFYGLTYELGPKNVRDLMLKATGLPETWAGGNLKGRTTLADPETGGTDSGLGIGQYEMRPIDQAVGFATFAAGGVHRDPYFVAKVTDSEGNQLLGPPADEGEQVIPADVANDVTFAIEGVAQYSKRALEGGREVASKTGTVGTTDQDNSDAWMVGYTPSISTAVWMGSDTQRPHRDHRRQDHLRVGAAGRDLAAVHERRPEGDAEGEPAGQGADPGRHRRGRARADHGGARRSRPRPPTSQAPVDPHGVRRCRPTARRPPTVPTEPSTPPTPTAGGVPTLPGRAATAPPGTAVSPGNGSTG